MAAEAAKTVAETASSATTSTAKNVAEKGAKTVEPTVNARAGQVGARVKRTLSTAEQKANNMTTSDRIATSPLDEKMAGWLRYNDPGPAQKQPFLLPPKGLLYNFLDTMDGLMLTAPRRAWEAINVAKDTTAAAIKTAIGPLWDKVKNGEPLLQKKHLANPIRIGTSILKAGSTIFNAGPRSTDESARALKRPMQRTGEKIPVVGKAMSFFGTAFGFIAKVPRKITEGLTRWIEKLDKTVADRQ